MDAPSLSLPRWSWSRSDQPHCSAVQCTGLEKHMHHYAKSWQIFQKILKHSETKNQCRWLHLRTSIHDNHSDLAIKSDAGQHLKISHCLRCSRWNWPATGHSLFLRWDWPATGHSFWDNFFLKMKLISHWTTFSRQSVLKRWIWPTGNHWT